MGKVDEIIVVLTHKMSYVSMEYVYVNVQSITIYPLHIRP
jgi:hypothetical protein